MEETKKVEPRVEVTLVPNLSTMYECVSNPSSSPLARSPKMIANALIRISAVLLKVSLFESVPSFRDPILVGTIKVPQFND